MSEFKATTSERGFQFDEAVVHPAAQENSGDIGLSTRNRIRPD
jgi:hypothetical protein